MAKQRNFSAAFKAKVALEALRGDQTLAELAGRHKIHANLITKWKRQAFMRGETRFTRATRTLTHARYAAGRARRSRIASSTATASAAPAMAGQT